MADMAARDSTDGPDEAHRVPEGVSDETVAALGKLSEALETVERARGHLWEFHQLTGHADLMLDDVVDKLSRAGHADLSGRVERELVGRNVIEGRWTFQIVEDYDDNYRSAFRELERDAREQLVGGKRHLFEARMKEVRRSRGLHHHEALPPESTTR